MNCKCILFDWGNVLLPIDASKTVEAFKELRAPSNLKEKVEIFHPFEKGEVSSKEFLSMISSNVPSTVHLNTVKEAWNLIIQDFPNDHFEVLKKLKKKYKLILVSNTNEIHADHIKTMMGPFAYKKFISCFDQVFFSFEMGKRKPDVEFFEHVLDASKSAAGECLLIDDTVENLDVAKKMGFLTKEFNVQNMNLKEKISEWGL